jgi:UDP-N-acetylglucosamine--N-acetylmuramyl-(pentapeptide) pyrophosphoryl-undecaprenol N-acetylglucosamine transferase
MTRTLPPTSTSTPTARTPSILLAAGGTGGHVFPAEALARELLARGLRVGLVTDRRGGAFGDALPEVTVHRIHAASPGGGAKGALTAALRLGQGLIEANRLVRRLRPAAVVAFGGYACVPTAAAAALAGIPTILHEQNAVLGRANRLLAGRARRIAVAFTNLSGVRESDRAKLVRTGNPVRPPIAARQGTPYRTPDGDGPVLVFVTGGSQGARVFSEVVPAALALLPADLRARLHLAQQCRPEDLDGASAALAPLGLGGVELQAFFTDVPDRLVACHLAVCRAGASTVAELTCIGRPAILVPYPHATDDHQTANAAAVAAAGAAWTMPQGEFTASALAGRLSALLTQGDELGQAAAAARRWGTSDAAARLAHVVLDVAGLTDGTFGDGNGNHAPSTEAAE